ncbi:hypothetical protein JCM8547_008575 [Rhodosporidiobolus lusitaniae]
MHEAERPLRVLGLPGYGTNAAHLEGKLRQAKKLWGDEIELVCMEPPHLMSIPTLVDNGGPSSGGDGYPALPSGCTQNARRWWRWENHRWFDDGELEAVLVHLREFLEKEGPFDACIGFSQGAATAVLLLALLEHPHLHPLWSAPSKNPNVVWPPEPFKAAVLCSAFGPGDPRYQEWYKGELKPVTPTLHLIGKNDVVANPQHSLDTVARFHKPKVVWHDGGHHIPRKLYYAHMMKDFLLCSAEDGQDEWEDERRDGWGSPTESIADSIGEGNSFFPAVPLSPRLSLVRL